MSGEERHCYRFGAFDLDIRERQLLRDDVPVSLPPKAFDVLALLVDRSGHLIEKDDLMRIVWPDSFVEEANVARVIHKLRRTLGDDHNGNKFIETVPKKGYRFVAEVEDLDENLEPEQPIHLLHGTGEAHAVENGLEVVGGPDVTVRTDGFSKQVNRSFNRRSVLFGTAGIIFAAV